MSQSKQIYDEGLFTIRGNLDGELEQEYIEKEQFIGLKIDQEEFFLPIAVVNEIVMLQPVTFVPQSGTYIEGVMNLRGRILPAINLRKMMGLNKGKATTSTRIIIAQINDIMVGLIVDAITYVISLLPSEIEVQTLPSKLAGADLISRISKSGNNIKGILDLGKIVLVSAEGKIPSNTLTPADP